MIPARRFAHRMAALFLNPREPMKNRHTIRLTGTAALAALALTAAPARAQITTSLLDEETDIVNTGGALVSACHFQNPASGDPDPLVVNGIPHTVGKANAANLTENMFFEGDFRNGGSGLPQDGSNILQVLLSGIAGANPINMSISGLTVGTEYLFQAYWEADLNESLTITLEGDTVNSVPAQKPGGLISYQFTAGDDTLNAFFDRDDGGTANNWLSGYSLQEVAASAPEVVSTEPVDDSAAAAPEVTPTILFDKAVQPGTGSIGIYKAGGALVETIGVTDVTPPGTVTFDGPFVTITPSNLLESGTEHYILVDGTAITETSPSLLPFAGISDPTEWSFTIDVTPPVLLVNSCDPADGATDVQPYNNPLLVFDENVVKGTGNIVVRSAADDTEVESIDVEDAAVSVNGPQVRVVLSGQLTPGSYYVEIDSGAFTDVGGNVYPGISGDAEWTFTTSTANGLISIGLLDEETDIVNTGGALVSACHFQGAGTGDPDPLVVNGVSHTVGTGNDTNLTINTTGEGDFRNGGSGLPQDGSNIVQVLLSGIAYANGITMSVSGLTPGQEYLFQAYWEDDLPKSLTVTMEGTATVNRIPAQKPGVLISYQFTAGDDTLNAFFDRDDNVGGSPNNWLSGYSLQSLSAAATPYADWASGQVPPLTGGFNDDDDLDGTPNGHEFYYFDSDPNTPEGLGSPVTGATKTGANTFEFTHNRRIDRDDVSETYLWSSDLVTWYAADGLDSDGTNTVSVADGPVVGGPTVNLETVTAVSTVGGPSMTKLFVRQELSSP
jgi:methionine-rich copper-binding protein CopC